MQKHPLWEASQDVDTDFLCVGIRGCLSFTVSLSCSVVFRYSLMSMGHLGNPPPFGKFAKRCRKHV